MAPLTQKCLFQFMVYDYVCMILYVSIKCAMILIKPTFVERNCQRPKVPGSRTSVRKNSRIEPVAVGSESLPPFDMVDEKMSRKHGHIFWT